MRNELDKDLPKELIYWRCPHEIDVATLLFPSYRDNGSINISLPGQISCISIA